MNYRIIKIFIALSVIPLVIVSCGDNAVRPSTLFQRVPSSHTRIDFQNILREDENFNIIEYLYFYNGGGVAAGDINNDGLPDLCFTANMGSNRMYLNKGNLEFEDITSEAGIAADDEWNTGVTMGDVNGDGFLDIFICGVGNYKKFRGKNRLFINNGDLTFTERTEEYGLSFSGFSTQSAFFDFDRDGDLDMYLLNHSVHSVRTYGKSALRQERDPFAGDKLYRNEIIPSGVNRFTDVTGEAGILSSQIGYGLGVGISDLNNDGYPDIYVSNDFHENDYLYINQGNGTFRQVLEQAMAHTSRFSMGNDISDINNDGWSDIITLDMLPDDEEVIKTTAGEDSYDVYEFKLRLGYHPQVMRNTLQLNRGLSSAGVPVFSDIALFSGVEATDWSWAPLIADFDNDGYKDLFVANGIVRRPNDLDYIHYMASDSAQHFSTDEDFIERMPHGSVPNVIFRNGHDLTFKNVTAEWLGTETSSSTGAVYADLDGDGDLDIVTNNVNEKAHVYRNEIATSHSRFLRIKLNGADYNRFGVGARVSIYSRGTVLQFEQYPSRGWQSSVDHVIHAGVGDVATVDSITVVWPSQLTQTIRDVTTNRHLNLFEKDATKHFAPTRFVPPKWALQRLEDSIGRHTENLFVSFHIEESIPHMLSTQGPRIAVADVNGDRLEDFFIGGASGQPGSVFFQTLSGHFSKSIQPLLRDDALREDVGSAFFYADKNSSPDLLVTGGGQQFGGKNRNLAPALYLNDGRGNFNRRGKLPDIFTDASCVKPADFDGDGDIDLFIGGRVVAHQYGINPRSYLLVNDGDASFTDASEQCFGAKTAFGMVTDAEWVDLNKDNRPDLIVVGEWMPVTIFIQTQNGEFVDQTASYGLKNTTGWWNEILACDFDRDGDQDLIAGNVGLNSRLRARPGKPVQIYIQDIDTNGDLDHVMTYYHHETEYPFISRDQLVKQVPYFKRKFLKYHAFRKVKVCDILPGAESQYIKKSAEVFASSYFENTGVGKFVVRPLPAEAQFFPIFSFQENDVNKDGHVDILAVGNLLAVQPDIGRYDAGYGLIMLGDGKGNFQVVNHEKSGFFLRGEGRDIASLTTPSGNTLFIVGRNNDSVLFFKQEQ